ncbi:helix-turn-helix transcriptional regulator [Niabella ginsengisoli]|uniref:YafY family transcriptional regulator n=1 Tax=Niabella ginsengisoli TaxID=522298 RepID=A0ABS9SHN9_9BACT|nr:YafY family protein [Niabella ginsengisoli]MCH5597831.1 YafY family transcriptional regulator [Niabella ginsengisoli]
MPAINNDILDESPKKFDRVIAILTQLQSKRIVKAQDLADRFGVSLRTIYRDIKTLEASGVPVSSEAGVGYSIVEGYKLPPVMFTKDEAVSFVAAEKLMQHFTDKSIGTAFQAAMFKVKSVLRWAEKDWMDMLDERILVQPKNLLFNKDVPNALEILMHGIVNKKQVQILYHSFDADEPVNRSIEPIGLYHEKEYWYLVAYCHLRKDHRNFRADRIIKIARLESDFILQHKELSFYLQRPERNNYVTIKIQIESAYVKYIKQSRILYGFVSEKKVGDKTEMTFEYAEDPEYFIRWFIVLADKSDILEPESVRNRLSALVSEINNRLQQTAPIKSKS